MYEFPYDRVSPTGVIRYNPEKCWNGLTLIPATGGTSTARGAVLYDMNGNIVHRWEGLYGSFDNKLLPGGYIMGTTGYMLGYWLDCLNLVQQDWDGNTVWSFNKGEEVPDLKTGQPVMSARQHHDYQREGNNTGYFNSGQEPKFKGKTLVNSTVTRVLPEFSPHPIADTKLMEVDEDGNCLWSWSLFDHWDQLGIETIGKAVHYHFAPLFDGAGYVKVTYCNNINYLGPNRFYDAGDERFHPENIISDIRNLNTSFIIDKKTGDIVWRLGPDFESTKQLQDIGQIVGQHHVHMIQPGLPGAGNILLFDNGGQAGLGRPTPCAPNGHNHATRGYSRVLEINPATLEVVWAFNDPRLNFDGNTEALSIKGLLFSQYCSSADRLPNGNTLITEFQFGRILEVTVEGEIVWEFINPGGKVFRAHRYPYSWCPQVKSWQEDAVAPVHNSRIRLNTKGEPVLVDEDDFFTHVIPM
ncbi:arylsulfotransferase family protein [Desulfovibrio sp. OttesenSCG-928-C06]|nr:arylsulfotransferase family protein [Desulfovibrio sp. OttesenSCG-928-C06]